VQILGGIGSPSAELHATQLTRRLANLLGGVATLLPAPGAVGSADARRVMVKDRYVQEAMGLFKSITIALVGIGAVTPSKMLAASGNVFSAKELKSLSDRGAVGDICLRFFDANGVPVVTPLNDRVIAIELSELKRVDRVVGIAGGRRKFAAIRGALRGRRVNVLITDRATAERLVRSAVADGQQERDRPAAAAVSGGS
jgi:DNA-binding transcriptional regulator LsrR (DeoR family)